MGDIIKSDIYYTTPLASGYPNRTRMYTHIIWITPKNFVLRYQNMFSSSQCNLSRNTYCKTLSSNLESWIYHWTKFWIFKCGPKHHLFTQNLFFSRGESILWQVTICQVLLGDVSFFQAWIYWDCLLTMATLVVYADNMPTCLLVKLVSVFYKCFH